MSAATASAARACSPAAPRGSTPAPGSAGPGTDWVFTANMRFPDGVLATFDCGTALCERDELEAIGSEGSLFLDDPWHCNEPVIEVRRAGGRSSLDDRGHGKEPGIEVRRAGGTERIELEPLDSYRLELENLSDAIR